MNHFQTEFILGIKRKCLKSEYVVTDTFSMMLNAVLRGRLTHFEAQIKQINRLKDGQISESKRLIT